MYIGVTEDISTGQYNYRVSSHRLFYTMWLSRDTTIEHSIGHIITGSYPTGCNVGVPEDATTKRASESVTLGILGQDNDLPQVFLVADSWRPGHWTLWGRSCGELWQEVGGCGRPVHAQPVVWAVADARDGWDVGSIGVGAAMSTIVHVYEDNKISSYHENTTYFVILCSTSRNA